MSLKLWAVHRINNNYDLVLAETLNQISDLYNKYVDIEEIILLSDTLYNYNSDKPGITMISPCDDYHEYWNDFQNFNERWRLSYDNIWIYYGNKEEGEEVTL